MPDRDDERPPSAEPGADRSSFSFMSLAGLGLVNACSVALGLVLGSYLDGRFGTAPVLVLTGLTIGLTLGAVGSFLEIRRHLQD